jgi:hypothetical protein
VAQTKAKKSGKAAVKTVAKAAPKKATKKKPRSGVALDPGVFSRLKSYRARLAKKMEERIPMSRAVGIAVAAGWKAL